MKRKADNAAFDRQDAECVLGPRPTCCITGGQHVDLHHILGRGFDHGARPGDEERAKFGSLYNCVPLCPEVHHGPMRDSVEMRWLFLRLAAKRVEQAVIYNGYRMNGRDERFLEFVKIWKESHPVC